MLPRFEIVARRRPVDLVAPGTDLSAVAAPYVALEAALAGSRPGALTLAGTGLTLTGWYDGTGAGLRVTTGGQTTEHRSRRHGRTGDGAERLGLSLTGTHVTVLTRAGGAWTARGRFDLAERVDSRGEELLGSLRAHADGATELVRAGGFGQLGLRDLRVVTQADGTAYRLGGRVVLTATSAGPGFFDTAHTSVWALAPDDLTLTHLSDLFFRRPDRPGVFGDHATHLVRRGERWLVATSTWGDFDRRRPDARVGVTLAETGADLLTGRHVLDTTHLALPTTGLTSVGVWDPHLVHTGDEWLVGYVSARKYFAFHPVLASGPDPTSLTLRAAAADRRATEGTTLLRIDGQWRVLASDGREGRRGQRAGYPVLDLDLAQVGSLDAPYPTNIPWPSLVRVGPEGSEDPRDWLLVGFDGAPYGGDLLGYGTHGQVVLARGRD